MKKGKKRKFRRVEVFLASYLLKLKQLRNRKRKGKKEKKESSARGQRKILQKWGRKFLK